MSDIGKALGPLARRIGNLLSRGVVGAANGAGKLRTLQVRMLAGETKDGIEHFEPYGWSSEPFSGAEHISAFFDGDRSHGVTLIVADRRYRLRGLKAGEVAIFDDQGQKVHLTRDGIVIDGAALPISIQNTPSLTVTATDKMRFETPLLEVTGEIKDRCDTPLGKTMYAMRIAYNGHTHNENNAAGGPTNQPNQTM